MKDYSFDDVIRTDHSLYKLAYYEVTKGLIPVIKTPEAIYDLEEEVAHKFNYFKNQIKNGECTYEFIKTQVLNKNGAHPKGTASPDFSTDIQNWDEEYKSLKGSAPADPITDFVKKLMDNLVFSKQGEAGQPEFTIETVIEPQPPTEENPQTKKRKKKSPKKD